MTTDEIRARVEQTTEFFVYERGHLTIPVNVHINFLISTIKALLQCDEVIINAINKYARHSIIEHEINKAVAERDKILGEIK